MMARIQHLIFIVLFLTVMGILAWLSEHYSAEWDLTWGNRNSLTEASIDMLGELDQPITITAFVHDSDKVTRDVIKDLVGRYRRHKPDIDLRFLNPDLVPQLVREHGITVSGEIQVQYNKRQDTLKSPSEKGLTQLLLKLADTRNNYIAFLSGHGERSLLGVANHDLGDFGKQLEQRGFILQPINLIKTPAIPDNTRVLVISSPKTPVLEGELQLIEDYLDKGGNLLWLTEPAANDGLAALAAYFDVKRLPGQVVDATSRLFGINDPTFALITEYPSHTISEQLHSQTLFPQAAGLLSIDESEWSALPILQTLVRSWTELSVIEGNIRFNEGTEERPGPITIGLAFERQMVTEEENENPGMQRAVIIGDGDFLSNTYLGNGQNQSLGNAVLQWLSHHDSFIDIHAIKAPDTQLQISPRGAIALLLTFLVGLPLWLLGVGVTIWFKRLRR